MLNVACERDSLGFLDAQDVRHQDGVRAEVSTKGMPRTVFPFCFVQGRISYLICVSS